MLLSVKNLTVGYGDQIIVENISFDLPRGKILAIVGESGSGKSTVLKAINGLLGRNGRIIDGTITFDGRDITSIDDRNRSQRSFKMRHHRFARSAPSAIKSMKPFAVTPIGRKKCFKRVRRK